jgi:hypothetical protein
MNFMRVFAIRASATNAQLEALVRALREHPIVSEIDLSHNKISDFGARCILQLMREQILSSKQWETCLSQSGETTIKAKSEGECGAGDGEPIALCVVNLDGAWEAVVGGHDWAGGGVGWV